ncbi:MAG: DUF1801 domain-containing protein [Saprospiraceae bacterium]|nr:DUF1801 domain-containing protein [Saprospiraceae bacterium]MBK7221450.1 DUF1801 domain-containing protein [Saprospiraceae bacterium]MBK7788451.1 DUF1801 domain-containing protein [Saprospiraceae bacterium]MBK8851668.1 DUF1801 domain-containing protein [Saprospiraceae bacterium]
MQSKATTVEEYLNELPEDRIAAMLQLQKIIKKNLPKGFSEEMNYGMLGYVVPHKLYPAGYHCDPKLPLPFLAIASQKNFIAIYHMGIYADPKLHDWFTNAYAELNIGKLDMGKSCIRFKNPAKIPFDLIGELVSKMSPQQWIALYESNYKK